jgi:hypothetical protein
MGAQLHHHRHADQASGDGQGEPTPSARTLVTPGKTPATLWRDAPFVTLLSYPSLHQILLFTS